MSGIRSGITTLVASTDRSRSKKHGGSLWFHAPVFHWFLSRDLAAQTVRADAVQTERPTLAQEVYNA